MTISAFKNRIRRLERKLPPPVDKTKCHCKKKFIMVEQILHNVTTQLSKHSLCPQCGLKPYRKIIVEYQEQIPEWKRDENEMRGELRKREPVAEEVTSHQEQLPSRKHEELAKVAISSLDNYQESDPNEDPPPPCLTAIHNGKEVPIEPGENFFAGLRKNLKTIALETQHHGYA